MLRIMAHRDSFTTDVVHSGGSAEREARTKSNAQIGTRKTHHSLLYSDGLIYNGFSVTTESIHLASLPKLWRRTLGWDTNSSLPRQAIN